VPAFRKVAADVSFPSREEDVLGFWERTNAFAESIRLRPPEQPYTFYDGPPFPTGSPHYGNLLAGVIKDIVPRYWTMRGFRVERRFGWDTHGLPIEIEVQKALGLNGPADIERIGVAAFNRACRQAVETNTAAWESITRRIGRWVDFEHAYRTMDLDFMESVWWTFRQLWDRGLVYQAKKVLPYSYGATTPLSNFEANLDYRDTEDPAITVGFRVTKPAAGPARAGDVLPIWTTTPWTLPANLAIAVSPQITYSRVRADLRGKPAHVWVAEELRERCFPEGEVVASAPGRDLLGTEYAPAFDFFAAAGSAAGAFRVIPSGDVNTQEGTGLVHMAPAYGEADFAALQAAGITLVPDPLDAEARFTEAAPELAGFHIKQADQLIMERLKAQGMLLRTERIRHSYPFCWRTGTPLIQRAIPTWFVRVEGLRDRMAELNRAIHWVPEVVGARRFGNWLEEARDWAVSRNRYWASCIPVWVCPACANQICIGSIAELKQQSGVELSDLHKDVVDEVEFPCAQCSGTMRRVPEVLDVWFESGSMPYAQSHYPFENQETFNRRFPADFIAEGLDQTRGWFYTLLVLSTALFDREPFRNCVVTGLILSEDGRKMSKSLKNYPDPYAVIAASGADALRAYLINSPVLRAEPLRFVEAGVREVVRTVLLPLWNAYSFFTTYAEADGIGLDSLAQAPPPQQRAELDRWILSVLQSLVDNVNRQMQASYLYSVIPPLLDFIDQLTNWYIRRSRRRFWRRREEGEADKLAAFATLYEVLETFTRLLAPVLPFVTEQLYQGLVVDQRPPTAGAPVSVHHADYPVADGADIDRGLEEAMASVQVIVRAGRSLRTANHIRTRQPLPTLTVLTRDPRVRAAVEGHRDVIADELNVKQVEVSDDEGALVELSLKPNYRVLGPRLGSRMGEVAGAIQALPPDRISRLLAGETIDFAGVPLTVDDLLVQRQPRPGLVVTADRNWSVALDCSTTPELVSEGLAREVVNRVQALRRQLGLQVSDRIRLGLQTQDPDLLLAIQTHRAFIANEVLAIEVEPAANPPTTVEIEGIKLGLAVEKAALG